MFYVTSELEPVVLTSDMWRWRVDVFRHDDTLIESIRGEARTLAQASTALGVAIEKAAVTRARVELAAIAEAMKAAKKEEV